MMGYSVEGSMRIVACRLTIASIANASPTVRKTQASTINPLSNPFKGTSCAADILQSSGAVGARPWPIDSRAVLPHRAGTL
jgi:hypothetical protein